MGEEVNLLILNQNLETQVLVTPQYVVPGLLAQLRQGSQKLHRGGGAFLAIFASTDFENGVGCWHESSIANHCSRWQRQLCT